MPINQNVKKKPKRKIKLDYSNDSDTSVIEMLNVVQNNELLKKLESMNSKSLESENNNILFPHLDDKEFNNKLLSKKEFNDLKIDTTVYDVEERSNLLCSEKTHFELLPHQQFVKNFLSSQTPYNGLLLYHGLGTGKTCSGISIAEEMRSYLKQMGINKRIIIVASPNVQENFKSQLFNKRQLNNINGIWNLESCTGNKFLKEINPMNMKGLNKENIEKLIKRIINKNYLFMGPEQFSNYIYRTISSQDSGGNLTELSESNQIKAIKKEFSNRLVIIDEIHNIKTVKDIPEKKTTQNIIKLVKHTDNLKLLLLSATPIFNATEEIVWLLNILNINDNRAGITPNEVFDKDSNLIVKGGEEVGKNILIQKSRGYISYVRGDNPYTYPFRLYPKYFSETNTMATYIQPKLQLNNAPIIQGIQFLDLYINTMQEYQESIYNYIIKENIDLINNSKAGGIGYHLLGSPLQSLNMVYPSEDFDSDKYLKYDLLIGKKGLSRIMKYTNKKTKYEYKPDSLKKYGKIFQLENIKNYSHKIYNIINSVINSDGIVLIYSQYIEGGCVPIALALEEAGFTRYGRDNLLSQSSDRSIGNYCMITGDVLLSHNNSQEIKEATSDRNINGEHVKVIIISEAGSEGIDLKNIRQIHIMEPWYNMNRIEQIIGRGVRNCSHKLLPFNKRNVQIFLYGTILKDTTIESADMYVYRIAERKAVKIGIVTRILKENAIDCSLNRNVLTEKTFSSEKNIVMGNTSKLTYNVGDKPFTSVCDFMDTCEYECNVSPIEEQPTLYTYNEYYINVNIDSIIIKIKDLFTMGYLFDKIDIIKFVNQSIVYPIVQINSALDKMINDNSIIIFDILQRPGNVINVGKFYIYQPLNMNNTTLSIYDRIHPNKYKLEKIRIVLPENIEKIEEFGEGIFKTLKHKFKYRNIRTIISKGVEDMDWYKAAGNALNISDVSEFSTTGVRFINLMTDVINDALKIDIYISHMIDVISIENKKNLLEYLFIAMKDSKITNEETVIFRDSLFEKFRTMMIEDSDKLFIVFGSYESNSLEYFEIIDEKIQKAKPVDMKKILKAKKISYSKLTFSNYIGFMAPFKKSYSIFKIKDTRNKRDTGYRCDQKGKIDILRILNKTMNEGMEPISKPEKEFFSYKNTILIENAREMCADQEILFRYLNTISSKGKTWFLSLEDYLFTKLI